MKNFIKKTTSILFSAILIISQTSCSSKEIEPVSSTVYELLNTTCTITIYDMEQKRAEKIIDDAFNLCRDYEKKLSKTIEGSEIYNINNSGGEPAAVSSDTLTLIEKGIYYAELSDGRFDITVGRLSSLWNFKDEVHQVPSQELIDEAVKTIDYKNIRIDKSGGQAFVSLSNPDAEIDLGGIAKGYIADKVSEFLISEGTERAIVNLGGNIVAIGNKADGTKWNIGVEKPFSGHREIVGSVSSENQTIVTSGLYERCFELDGRLYHHILDVKTGYPCESDVDSVTLVAGLGQSADCDALSTICLMSGVEEGLKIINAQEGIEALFLSKDGHMTMTDGMKNIYSSI